MIAGSSGGVVGAFSRSERSQRDSISSAASIMRAGAQAIALASGRVTNPSRGFVLGTMVEK